MSSARVTHHRSSNLTDEQARDARARALHFVIGQYLEKQKAAGTNGGKDAAKKETND